MRIVFFGATELGFQCCQQLLGTGENVVGIFSIPQEFQISYSLSQVRNVTFRNFADLADRLSVPFVHMTTKMSESQYIEALRAWRPDFGLVIGWYHMVPSVVRDLFPLGIAGIHASLLPKYRGGAPLVWAIINGEKRTGVSFFYFDGGVDTGDIIAQEELAISENDTIKDIYQEATRASLNILRQYIPRLREGKAPRIPQNNEAATQFPQRKPDDGLIDWKSQTAKQIHNWIRAQTRPYPGAFTYLGTEKVSIWRAGISGFYQRELAPGTMLINLVSAPDAFGVCCADGQILQVDEVGPPHGVPMSGAEFIAANSVEDGIVLGTAE